MSAGPPSIRPPVHETRPAVFLIARPALDLQGMRGYLDDVGGDSWLQRRLEQTDGELNAGELLVEFAGRACYRSWEPGLNPNVRKVRTDQREYFANILRSAHGSVLEHANYRSEEHTSELQSQSNLVCRLLLEKKNTTI